VKSTTSTPWSGCTAREPTSILARLTDASITLTKRKQILDAAVRVFADDGYHGARVSDVAAYAGVAHGLVYHYFDSKEGLLRAIFRENWNELLQRFRAVEYDEADVPEKLAAIGKILLRTWGRDPALVTVMVRDVARAPELRDRVDEVREAFEIVQRIIEQGQATGALRKDVDARFASWVFYGGLEEILTGWVLGQLPEHDDAVATAEKTAIEIALRGLGATPI
jgi:TetR/AcrR family fatty acid metabolism transcriptional regulator